MPGNNQEWLLNARMVAMTDNQPGTENLKDISNTVIDANEAVAKTIINLLPEEGTTWKTTLNRLQVRSRSRNTTATIGKPRTIGSRSEPTKGAVMNDDDRLETHGGRLMYCQGYGCL